MGANFTPAIGPYKNLQQFRFWCQKVLPLVYDDSLSYYELLCKVIDYLNKTMEDVSTVTNDMVTMLSAFNALQDYVNTYFDNLDLTASVQIVLDRMAENGTLSNLLRPIVGEQIGGVVAEQIDDVVAQQIYNTVAQQIGNVVAEQIGDYVPSAVTSWLTENVDPVGSAVIVDSSLTITGAAADAKETGDAIREIQLDNSAITTERIVGMVPTGEKVTSNNLFKYATLYASGKAIYSIANGIVTLTDNASYDTYIIRVDGSSIYTFTNYRSAVVISDLDLTAVGTIKINATDIDSTGGKYILFTFSPATYSPTTYVITTPFDAYYIPNDWDISHKVIYTPQIDGMLPTGNTVESSNIFNTATLVEHGKYVDRIEDGVAILTTNASYDTYIIPVDGTSTYKFTNARTAALISDLDYTAVGSLITYATSISSVGGAYILFSFNPTTYPASTYVVTYPVPQYAVPANWELSRNVKNCTQIKTGALTSGGTISLSGKTAIKYGQRIVFKALLSTFGSLKLAFYNYNNSAISNSITVDGTNITIVAGSTTISTDAHGLTIANDISIVVDYSANGVKITVESNGNYFSINTTFEALTSGVVSPSIVSTGTACSDTWFYIAVPRAKKGIWYFGDSYISYTNPARWAYYLQQNGYDKDTLLNGYAGGTSATTVMALQALLEYGTPDMAIFATGMNDGSDSESAPSASWVTARGNFLTLCQNNGITPIFATVPTVPSVNNEQKNAWIRSSGYRYIDFAAAVGANSSGVWFSGMLSTDNVHPTNAGAYALYTQAISDIPEFLATE